MKIDIQYQNICSSTPTLYSSKHEWTAITLSQQLYLPGMQILVLTSSRELALNVAFFLSRNGRGGGQVVSMLAYYSDDPTSIPAEAYIFSVKLLLKSTKIKKRPGLTQKKGENGPMLASFSIAFRLFNMSQFKYVAFFFYSKTTLQKCRPYPTSVKSILL